MPLFMCTKCGTVDNTATSGYWAQQADALVNNADFKPLCSACHPEIGCWHNLFPRRSAEGYKQDRRGFLYRIEELATVPPNFGPFTDVVLPAGVAAS
jgi:hypothetical protein